MSHLHTTNVASLLSNPLEMHKTTSLYTTALVLAFAFLCACDNHSEFSKKYPVNFPYMVTAVSSDPALTPTAEYLTQYVKKLIEDLGDQVTKLLEDGCEMGKAATDLGLSLWPVASLAH